MSITKIEIDLVITLLLSIMKIIHAVDPESDKNPVVIKINEVIALLQNLGI